MTGQQQRQGIYYQIHLLPRAHFAISLLPLLGSLFLTYQTVFTLLDDSLIDPSRFLPLSFSNSAIAARYFRDWNQGFVDFRRYVRSCVNLSLINRTKRIAVDYDLFLPSLLSRLGESHFSVAFSQCLYGMVLQITCFYTLHFELLGRLLCFDVNRMVKGSWSDNLETHTLQFEIVAYSLLFELDL